MKRVMIIAGGDWQIDLVKKAKEMGLYVLCSNLYENSPCFKYSDEYAVADILDKEKNLEIAKKFKPNAIISDQSDLAVPTVAYLNEKMGLRGIGNELSSLFTDKSEQRLFCKKNGIDVPDFEVCSTYQDGLNFFSKYKKIIIKPIDSQSSRGVFTITNINELKEKYQETMNWSNRKKVYLAEEYIDGDEFTIDGVVLNGVHYPLCISIKEMNPQNKNISMVQSYSHSSDRYDYSVLRKTNKDFVEKTGLSMGLTHSEYKFYKGKFYLIESGARGGGSNLSSRIVPFVSGIDNYYYLINEALGNKISNDELERINYDSERYAIMRFFNFKPGKVSRIEGLEELRNSDLLIDYQINVKPGDIIETPKYGRQRPGHFIVGGNSKELVQKEAIEILNNIKIIYD